MNRKQITFDPGYNVTDSRVSGVHSTYILNGEFGHGGQGKLFDCTDENDNELVAKFYTLKRPMNNDMAQRISQYKIYWRELNALKELSSSGNKKVPELLDFGTTSTGNIPFIVIEKLEVSVLTVTKASNYARCTNYTALCIVYMLVNCLHSISEINLVHCDIKLDNFCFALDANTPGYLTIKIIDFGCSEKFGPESLRPLSTEKETFFWSGTYAFFPRAAYLRMEPTSYDDLESLMYAIVKLFGGQLDWSTNPYGFTDFQLKRKEDFCRAIGLSYRQPLKEIIKYFAKYMNREDEVPYDSVKELIWKLILKEERDRFFPTIIRSKPGTSTPIIEPYKNIHFRLH